MFSRKYSSIPIRSHICVCVFLLLNDKSKRINYVLHNGLEMIQSIFVCTVQWAGVFCWSSRKKKQQIINGDECLVLRLVSSSGASSYSSLPDICMNGHFLLTPQNWHTAMNLLFNGGSCLAATHNFLFHERNTLFSTICWNSIRCVPSRIYITFPLYTCLRSISSKHRNPHLVTKHLRNGIIARNNKLATFYYTLLILCFRNYPDQFIDDRQKK